MHIANSVRTNPAQIIRRVFSGVDTNDDNNLPPARLRPFPWHMIMLKVLEPDHGFHLECLSDCFGTI